MNAVLSAIPAYGRTYSTPEEMVTAFDSGKDFQLRPNGPYFSQRDLGDMIEAGLRELRLIDLRGGFALVVVVEEDASTASQWNLRWDLHSFQHLGWWQDLAAPAEAPSAEPGRAEPGRTVH